MRNDIIPPRALPGLTSEQRRRERTFGRVSSWRWSRTSAFPFGGDASSLFRSHVPARRELAALKWADVDLEHETIHVHRSRDRVRKRGVKPTKSETARRIPIEPTLLPLLKAMRREAGGKGYVFQLPSAGGLSFKLKRYLRRAGVTWPDLFASDATRKAITFHDLRATRITWMSARGDDPLRIMQRAGHEDLRDHQNLFARGREPLEGLRSRLPYPAPAPPAKRPEKPRDFIRLRKQPKTRQIRWS